MKSFLILLIVIAVCSSVQLKPASSIIKNTNQNTMMINNGNEIPEKIFAAEIHYSRIPHEYWEHRLQMVKAMGFNALSVYIMWNFHQIEKGKFDYQNGDKNLTGFLDLAKNYGLMILFRPGPFVCAEWDFGGMPARLLSIKNIKVRANNKPFLDEVKIYFNSLVPIMKKYSHTNSGPIIMLQIENEYGFYGSDKTYIQALRDLWKQLGINDIPEYYVDWIENIEKCHWQGANIGINNAKRQLDWVKARQLQPKGYLIGGEIYSGWLTHWGEKWQGKTIQNFANQFNFLMSNNHSFSMYVAHGGTNFALTAGSNGFYKGPFDFGGHITSYDYDAPINEQGSPTEKFLIFRQLALKHATWKIPKIPKTIHTIAIKPFVPVKYADFLSNLPEPTLQSVKQLVVFEDERLKMWNQGFVVYQAYLTTGTYQINITIHDFALVYLNGQFIKALDRSTQTNQTLIFTASHYENKLIILVEAMGHINFGRLIDFDFKGIVNFDVKFTPNSKENQSKTLNGSDFSWNITKIPIDENILNWKNRSDKGPFPHLFKHTFTLDLVGDTYLNMENWGKGYVFVNGHNLGRYWHRGPQERVYLPGVWLKKGENQIIVLELLTDSAKFIKGEHSLTVKNDVMIIK